ncbi:hypothetical protein M0R88_09405 [Halorussus gelatinilyticus]|uniref:Uncharacterized protein n=1 Tax=Halorussus gelatinilyticus TaxID=2937524 RepID=A0A8U0IQI7_9EURY|nr:hypothetical protein [Halorussus gelatinilyticus]UPW02289.1 hypothetical protein M0R88_09405 [Halorussus gelatinilyticus]
MATGRETKTTLAAWGLAGVPILATFVQTTLAMLETTLGSAGLGGIQGAIRSIAVFDAAAVLMWKSPTLVFGLFILIAGAWVAQGVAQFGRRNRDVTFAAAGLVSVLFFALFFGVYAPMFGMDVPTVQVVGFFAVPVLAAGAAIAAALRHDWDEKVVEEKSAELAEVASELDEKRETFEETYRRRIGDLDALSEVAPTGVERAEEDRREFRRECDDIAADLDAAERQSAEELRVEAASLRSRVDSLDPEAEIERIGDDLRDRVASGVKTTYGTVQCWSRYDRAYELVNLPGRFREIDVPAFDASVHIDRVSDVLLDRVEAGDDLQTVGAAVEQVDDHVERIEAHVGEREAAFAEAAEPVESDLETVEAKIERFDGRVADRLAELAIEGRHDDLPSVRTVRSELDAGKDDLHDCRFDDAERRAESAAADASDLVTLVEFVWSVVGTIDHGGERVSLPSGVDETLLAELRPAFERDYDVDVRVEGGAVRLAYPDGPATAESDAAPAAVGSRSVGVTESRSDGEADGREASGRDARDRRGERARPEEIIDSVLFVLRELKNAGRETDGDRAELQTDDLPESVATPAVLSQLEQFGTRQTDVVAEFDVQEGAPPGFVELVPEDGTSTDRAIDALHERYQEQYA